MPLVTPLNLSVQWNEDYDAEWLLRDAAGQAVDLTNYTPAMQVRAARGAGGSPLLTATATKLAEMGRLRVFIARTDIAGVSNGQHVWRGAWDLRLTSTIDSRRRVWAHGAFIIQPGVTQ